LHGLVTAMTTRRKLAAVALAAGLAVPASLTAGAALAPAQAVPYKMPAGTWGGLCGKGAYSYHVRYERHGVALYERRHYVEFRNRWSGSRWECRTRYSYDYLLLVA
jgi:hypothetical protein